ncbi:hypothetical protein PLESTB_001182700 [Pleodorina starrii]|uniref:Uncharacterized protein n=1 Tax=Pleodorina starrii TaxID=330485 RepID=A0A9W6BS63_9CHLO|nr:hypothetical protein PLESTM_000258700 [Pleodorina starrii]GLC57093.1 hypothetical protein PLESTB_001182700 [Pleodorina starrii]
MDPAEHGRVNPESIPRRKFGSGDPHTQTAEDAQGMVSGADEMKEGEVLPGAVADLVQEVSHQQFVEGEAPSGGGGGGRGRGSGGQALGAPPPK